MGKFLPWLASIWRFSARWVALMAGLFSIVREIIGLTAEISGHPLGPSRALAIFGHLAVVAFIIAGFSEWLFMRGRIMALEARLVRPGREHIAEVEAFLSSGIQLQHSGPAQDATPEAIASWREALNTWTNQTYNSLRAISVQGSIKFADHSGMMTRTFTLIHADVQGEFNLLDRRIGNLMQILERPETFLD